MPRPRVPPLEDHRGSRRRCAMRGRVLPNHRSAVAIVSFALTGLISLGPQAWAATRFMEVPIPTYGSAPWGIAPGPDGNLWFAEYGGNEIGRITTAGAITEFPIPTAESDPTGITAGPDGNLWFTEAVGKIGRITTAGAITGEFTIPTPHPDDEVIAAGPDGNLWFGEWNKLGRITTHGAIRESAAKPGVRLSAITAG